MNIELLNDMILENFVRVNKHPELELYIYNYTPKTQYEAQWNEITLACRGLILDGEGQVVARPFAKFFNIEELEGKPIPDLPFEVFEKMDGSLGISYWVDGEVRIATRGSFTSEQAEKANLMLNSRYAAAKAKMQEGRTYLFEIIYPENRIVVDYGEEESLTLLAVIDNETGKELPLEQLGFPLVRRYDGLADFRQLKILEEDNREGFVVKFQNDFRLKVKFSEYVRIHRIMTQVSTISIWEYLKDGKSFDEIIECVPDEFYDWVRETKAKLERQYAVIEAQAKADFKVLDSRKETAIYFMTCAYPKVLFLMLDNRSYNEAIWRRIRPDFERPFRDLIL
ncbi:MAG: RNA ligase [Bacteroidota bacterium]